MSVLHCAATTASRSCCPNCYAEQSHKDNVRSSAVGKQLKRKKRKKSNSLSTDQHHLPALDLFWASFFLRAQLTSLLLISPGLCVLLRSSSGVIPLSTTSLLQAIDGAMSLAALCGQALSQVPRLTRLTRGHQGQVIIFSPPVDISVKCQSAPASNSKHWWTTSFADNVEKFLSCPLVQSSK